MISLDKKILSDLDVAGKKVLVRVDFNVPQDAEGNITDDNRMVAALPTIQYLLDHKAAVILMSHLGRPKGEPNPKYTLKPIAKHLEELLGKPVAFALGYTPLIPISETDKWQRCLRGTRMVGKRGR